MKTHTNGEWKITGELDNLEVWSNAFDNNEKRIALVRTEDYKVPRYDEAEANAKLIAAAPEMLENLTRIIERIEENNLQDNFPSAYKRAKQVIKKTK